VDDLHVADLLPAIVAQAAEADAGRSISPSVIAALKANDVMAMSAAREIGGLAAGVVDIGRELEAVAGACASTAWCLWNHLATFHLFCGLLGPPNEDMLRSITEGRQWVCLPAGAGTAVKGRVEGDRVVLDGVAAFGTGARYADHAGVTFVFEGERTVRFALVDLRQAGIRIDADWNAMSLRASATDTVHYRGARVPLARVVPFPHRFREPLRDPAFPVISGRYREDWVGLCDLWLGWMATGLADAALREACAGIQHRRAILDVKMVERPTIHVNLGQAGAMIAAARSVAQDACRQADDRIAGGVLPTETDYLDQMAAGMTAARLCDEAMRLILRVLGGAGLREGPAFERRYRDLQAMPLHINVHPDRVAEQYGRNLLGLATENPF
jgi:alkylation response protein AidB-like acyl-CoA dehydrogenase